jgi:L-arabinokinase
MANRSASESTPEVLFYISGHGFGHASREVEIINALGKARSDIHLVIRSAVSPGLLARTLTVPYELRPGPCDSGIVQSSSVTHDDEATVQAAIEYFGNWESHIDAEVKDLGASRPAAIVADIPPVAFEVAARTGVPSFAISNFTWDWIYETHPGMTGAAPWIVPLIQNAYRKASHALELPFSGGFDVFPRRQPLPLVARHPTRTRQDTRGHFGLPHDRPAVLLSFGGYGLPELNLHEVDCLDRWTVVTTDRITPQGPPVPDGVVYVVESAFVGSGFRYEDLVAAVDVVLTKPGYGIVAECVATGTAMLYTSRGQFREYGVLVEGLHRFARSWFLPQADLFAGRWRAALDALVDQAAPAERMAADGAAVAARLISDAAR